MGRWNVARFRVSDSEIARGDFATPITIDQSVDELMNDSAAVDSAVVIAKFEKKKE